MDRRTFFRRSAAALAGVALAPLLPAAAARPVSMPVNPAVCDSSAYTFVSGQVFVMQSRYEIAPHGFIDLPRGYSPAQLGRGAQVNMNKVIWDALERTQP